MAEKNTLMTKRVKKRRKKKRRRRERKMEKKKEKKKVNFLWVSDYLAGKNNFRD